jgi:hypothetical protein
MCLNPLKPESRERGKKVWGVRKYTTFGEGAEKFPVLKVAL